MALKFRFARFARRTGGGRHDVRIHLRTQSGDFDGTQATLGRQRRNQRTDFSAGPGLDTLSVALSNERIDFVGLRPHLRFEPIRATSCSAKLLNEIKFLLACFARACLISSCHAAQGVELDQHRVNASFSFLDCVLDLLGVVLGVLAQFGLQFVDPVAKPRSRLLLLL